jgi:hypothetical protein
VQQRFLRACARSESNLDTARSDARQLYRWLIEPFAPQLVNAKMLVIDADGWLAGVPFPALLAGNGRYLVEDFAIAMSSVAPSNSPNDVPLDGQNRALVVSVPAPGGQILPCASLCKRQTASPGSCRGPSCFRIQPPRSTP